MGLVVIWNSADTIHSPHNGVFSTAISVYREDIAREHGAFKGQLLGSTPLAKRMGRKAAPALPVLITLLWWKIIFLEDSRSSTSVAFAGCFYTHVFLLLQRAPLTTLQCRHWSTSTPMRWSWPLATHALLRPSWRKLLASGSSRSSWQSVRRSAR